MNLLLPTIEQLDLAAPLAQFERDGYARLGRILTDEALAALTSRAEALMLGRVVYDGMFFQLDAASGRYEDAPLGLGWQGPSLSYRKLEKLEKDPLFLELIRNPLFERIARARIAGPVAIYRAILFNKNVSGGSELPWHQDGGRLWGLTEDPELQLWVALDDAPAGGGCLEVVPGSHRDGLASPLGGVVPEDKVRGAQADERAVSLPVTAGEAVVLHNLVWHRSGRGRPGHRRLGFSVCYLGAHVRCLRKRGAPRQFFRAFD